MGNKINDPIARLMGLRYKSHPWHGLEVGDDVPALYGFIPQSYCGGLVAEYAMQQTQRTDIQGDCDPLDICVLTERTISHGDIIARVRPIGGFRMLDGKKASVRSRLLMFMAGKKLMK